MKRSKNNKLIAGVCAGLAKSFSINVNILRVLFLISGFGIPLYFLLWMILPVDKNENESDRSDKSPSFRIPTPESDALIEKARNLIDEVGSINSFDSVHLWDGQASQVASEIKEHVRGLENKIEGMIADANTKEQEYHIDRTKSSPSEYQRIRNTANFLKTKVAELNEQVEKLESWIDRTPDTKEEAKEMISEYKLMKKELTLEKKDTTMAMRQVRDESREKMANMSFNRGKGARFLRDAERIRKERNLSSHQTERDRIDAQILAVDRRILWLERIIS